MPNQFFQFFPFIGGSIKLLVGNRRSEHAGFFGRPSRKQIQMSNARKRRRHTTRNDTTFIYHRVGIGLLGRSELGNNIFSLCGCIVGEGVSRGSSISGNFNLASGEYQGRMTVS